MGDTLESSAVKLAGLVAFQVLPCLARGNESLSWVTATSVSSSLLRLHMVLSRKSMGRLFKRSMLNFLTRKTCGLSASLTYQSSSPFFLPTRAVCCLPILPGFAVPAEPARANLIEHVNWPIEQARILGRDTRAARDRVIRVDPADDEDLLPVVDLVPDRLQHLAEHGRVRILAVHELAQVAEADVAMAQLRLGENAQAAVARVGVSLEGEVHLVDAVAL